MLTVKKCLDGVTSKEGNIFYTVKGRGVSRSSRKFRLMAWLWDSLTGLLHFWSPSFIRTMCFGAFWQLWPHLGLCWIRLRQLIAGLMTHLCRSGSGNILLLCTAGGINDLRRNRRLEESRRKNKVVSVTAQCYLMARRMPLTFLWYSMSGLLATTSHTTISQPFSGRSTTPRTLL